MGNKKNNHIDIDDYYVKEVDNFDGVKRNVSRVIILFAFLLIIGIIFLVYYFVIDSNENRAIKKMYQKIDENNLLLVYIGKDEKIIKQFDEYKNYYEIDYYNIKKNRLYPHNKRKIKKDLKVDSIKNTVAIFYKHKLVKSANVKNVDDLNKFLNKEGIIPSVLEDPHDEISLLEETLLSDKDILIYISFIKNDFINDKNDFLKEKANEYGINYQFIKGYLFGYKQLMKYTNEFGFTDKKNGILIILENKKIKKIYEDNYLVKDDIIELFRNYDIINSIDNYLNYIDLEAYKEMLKNREKQIFVFGTDKCHYCESIKYSLGTISKQYKIKINYVKVNKTDDIDSLMNSLNYKGTISYPFTIVTEDNNVIDYIFGDSEKKYFINFFTKIGVIR